jgi:hypothetical protein
MKKFLLLTLFCVTWGSYAQIKMSGVVKDSLDNPLELANVIAINKNTNGLESYGITNSDGKYVLSLGKNGTYTIQISAIGLKTINDSIVTKEADIVKNYVMDLDNTLDAVELTYEMPVQVRGDTLIYNADSFKNGTERKLEDVLEKLPGVEITDDGGIEVEGQRVQKVMVDGKDFFDGDTQVATKNIPSNVVDKIQVLKNYSENRQVAGVRNNQDNIAINIKLKEGKTNFWFGDVRVGAGASTDEALYIAQPKLFYYSPKYSINIIGDVNNIGEPTLNGRDLRSFGGGFRAASAGSGTNLNLGTNTGNFLNTDRERVERVESKFLAGNFSYSPKEELDFSGFAIYNSSRVDTRQRSAITYTDPELGIPDENTDQSADQATDSGLLKFSTRYIPNANNQLDYDILGRYTKEEQSQNFLSSVLGATTQIDENDPYSINQNLNYYFTLNEKNIFAYEAQHLFQDEDPFYNAVIEQKDTYDDTADIIGLDPDQQNYDLAQDRRIKTNQFDGKLDYYNVLNSKSNLNLFFGTIFSRQDFDSRIFQFLDDGSEFDPTPVGDVGATNDVSYNFSDLYLGARYTAKVGEFTFRPAVSFHAYGNSNAQGGEEFGEDFYRILPDVDIRWDIKNSESLTFRYNMANQFTDVTNLAQGLVLNNFNSLFTGEPGLENGLSQNLSLIYRNFNLFNFTNINGAINYSKREDQIRNIVEFLPNSVIRASTAFNSPFADETLTAFGRYQRTFGKIRAEFQARFDYQKFNQIINRDPNVPIEEQTPSVNENYTQTYRPGIRTNFREAPNINVRYTYSIQDVDQGANRNQIITNAPNIVFDAYIWKKFTFRTDYSYNSVDNGTNVNSFDIWNATLSYRRERAAKWEYEIRATNLLNTQSRINTNAGNISFSLQETFIQPRFVTLRVVYTL